MSIRFRQFRWLPPVSAAVVLCGYGLIGSCVAAGVSAPTFSKDVAPILSRNCVSCHRPGEIASNSSLLTYDMANRLAQSIKRQVIAHEMPPWPADPKASVKFRNDKRLNQRDIDTLVAWVDAGAPQGNVADLPAEPPVNEQWLYPGGRAPDVVLSLPEFKVKATGVVPYIQQLIKVPYANDRWIVAMQVRAGNRRLLHHMGITEVELPDGLKPSDVDKFAVMARTLGISDGAFPAPRAAVEDATNPWAYDMLSVYTPGTTFEMYGDDSGKLLKSGKNLYIDFNIHYTATGATESDRSQLALWFASTPPAHQLIRAPAAVDTIISNGTELLTDDAGTKAEGTHVAIPPIPAYAANYELIGMQAYTLPLTIYEFQPHAHMRAKDFTYVVVYPDGHEETVLTVPKYDFHWQLEYQLERPLKLPAGSKLIVTAHYDNSIKNYRLRDGEAEDPTHRCGPDKVAYFGRQNQSWDEMFTPLVQYSVDSAAPDDPGRPARGKQPIRRSLDIVQVAGCLAPTSSKSWMLRDASDTAVSESQATSAVELQSSAERPHGSRRYQLLGTQPFDPAKHAGRKVAVKGVLISQAGEERINVTSLQEMSSTCSGAPAVASNTQESMSEAARP